MSTRLRAPSSQGTPPAGEPVRNSGYTLTLYRKGTDGRWRLARDANLLTVRS